MSVNTDKEKSGCYFALNGIGGMLVAVVLLLSIVGVLSVLGLLTQQASANNPYVVSGKAVANPQTKEDVFANLKSVQMYDGQANSMAFATYKPAPKAEVIQPVVDEMDSGEAVDDQLESGLED